MRKAYGYQEKMFSGQDSTRCGIKIAYSKISSDETVFGCLLQNLIIQTLDRLTLEYHDLGPVTQK
jgi:hypothetical protein